jgi:hypothetical protein
VLYASAVGRRPAVAAALLQATSLPFIVTASQIGLLLGKFSTATAAGLIAAGLLSVVVFPPLALGLLRGDVVSADGSGRGVGAALGP